MSITIKQAMRREILQKLTLLSSVQISSKSRVIHEHLLAAKWWQEADLICFYSSMEKEVSTIALINQARKQNKRIALPRIEDDVIRFHDCTDPDVVLNKHNFGFLEPGPAVSPVDFSKIPGNILVLVPGLAFDYRKNRLGRGKGYYDKFLTALHKLVLKSIMNKITTIGICFSEQLVGGVPINPQDQPVDIVITEVGTIE